jgi:hypothetical protein
MPKLLTKQERDCLAKRIAKFYILNGRDVTKTCKHFMEEGICRNTVKRAITRLNLFGNAKTKSPGGRPVSLKNKKSILKIKSAIKRNPNVSVRKCSSKLKLPKSTYHWLLRNKLGFKAYKKQTVPKYVGDQKTRAKKGCRKIYEKLCGNGSETVLIMDDETYVLQDSNQAPTQKHYYAKTKGGVADEFRFKGKQKFPTKYLVWQAIDSNGNTSDSFISEGTMNSEIYLNECLKKRLLPFIKKYHSNGKILFWSDLSTSHYANIVLEWLNNEKIEYIEKKDNPPNVPQARPIEHFWAICKQEYAQRKNGAKNLRSFRMIWKKIALKVSNDHGKSIMASVKQKLRSIGRDCVLALFK